MGRDAELLLNWGYSVIAEDEDGVLVIANDEDTEAVEKLQQELGNDYMVTVTGETHPTFEGVGYDILVERVT